MRLAPRYLQFLTRCSSARTELIVRVEIAGPISTDSQWGNHALFLSRLFLSHLVGNLESHLGRIALAIRDSVQDHFLLDPMCLTRSHLPPGLRPELERVALCYESASLLIHNMREWSTCLLNRDLEMYSVDHLVRLVGELSHNPYGLLPYRPRRSKFDFDQGRVYFQSIRWG